MHQLPRAALLAFTKAVLTRAGLLPEDAALGAEVLIQSDFAGIASHGLSRLPMYVERIEQGLVNLRPEIRIVTETPVSMLVDCDNGMGIVNVPKIQRLAMDKVKNSGLLAVSMRNSTHYGAGSYYALRALERDLFSLLVTSTTPSVAPTGSKASLLGTNPITVTVPARKEKPIVLDMATSVVAMGKLQAGLREKKKIPPGWALDSEGRPTEDPGAGLLGSVLPIGGYKGYGLAVIIDILSALLSGSCYGNDIGRLVHAPYPKKEGIGHFLLLMDIGLFRPLDDFKAEVDKYIQVMKNAAKAEGVEEIFLAGEIEFNRMEEYSRNGVPVSAALGADLLRLGLRLGLATADDDFAGMVERAAKSES